MKRETAYKVAVIVLLIVNLVQVSFPFLAKKTPKDSGRDRKPNAIEILHLDASQNLMFKEFSKEHRKAMVLLQEEQKQCVRHYFSQPTDSLLNHIKNLEAKKIKTTKKHFEDMRSVLKEEQLDDYENFKKKALKYILR